MRLKDLSPRWLAYGGNARAGLAFLCPCCRATWLSCGFVAMKISDQSIAVEDAMDDGDALPIVPFRQGFAWKRAGDTFETMTVTPSIDASASGHWHGFITNGECPA